MRMAVGVHGGEPSEPLAAKVLGFFVSECRHGGQTLEIYHAEAPFRQDVRSVAAGLRGRGTARARLRAAARRGPSPAIPGRGRPRPPPPGPGRRVRSVLAAAGATDGSARRPNVATSAGISARRPTPKTIRGSRATPKGGSATGRAASPAVARAPGTPRPSSLPASLG